MFLLLFYNYIHSYEALINILSCFLIQQLIRAFQFFKTHKTLGNLVKCLISIKEL